MTLEISFNECSSEGDDFIFTEEDFNRVIKCVQQKESSYKFNRGLNGPERELYYGLLYFS